MPKLHGLKSHKSKDVRREASQAVRKITQRAFRAVRFAELGCASPKFKVGRPASGPAEERRKKALVNETSSNGVLRIRKIAWLLGYEGPTSFNSAFLRWTGRSASEMRNATQQVSASAVNWPRSRRSFLRYPQLWKHRRSTARSCELSWGRIGSTYLSAQLACRR